MGLLITFSVSAAIFLLIIPGDPCMQIIGGTEVGPHSKPYMALLNGTDICGGTLIKPRWVLTAAHCNVTRVILGAHSPLKREKEKQIFTVKKQIRHPCFSWDTRENDIQLLQLDRNAKLGKAVSPLPLPNKDADVKEGTKCQAAGWGTTNNRQQKISDKLMEVNVTIIDRRTCNDMKDFIDKFVITQNMLCAGDKNGGKDTCAGDSGGPLICSGTLRGITSYGPPGPCGLPGKAGVYTRISKDYLQWIQKMTGGDS